MPLPLETILPTPNAVYAPQILLQSSMQNGRLVTSAQITLGAAIVDKAGNWLDSTGQFQTIYISDVENLDKDLASMQDLIPDIMMGIIQLIGGLNAIRKII